MSKIIKNRGFSLAEVLIVAALLVVLSGVAFVAVWSHLRSLAQLERDAIAKEIYVAAQNHLTTAKSQGYLNLETTEYGTPGNSVVDQDPQSKKIVSYYLVAPSDQKIYDQMLPFGAVDETVLARGSYIIRYQPTSASVLDVFYCERHGRFAHTFSGTEYQSLVDDYRDVDKEGKTVDKKSARRNYGDDNAVIGWYGGENSVAVGERLNVPSIEIINAERLQIKVTDNNSSKITYASLKLIIEGEESEAKKAFLLTDVGGRVVNKTGSTYTVTLDEITNNTGGFHFCELVADTVKQFIPGENIKIFAVSYSNSTLTNVAKSTENTTNSLFGYDPKAAQDIAQISNIRHLENLDYRVSHVTKADTPKKAVQTTDLIWKKKDAGESGLKNPDGFVDIIGATVGSGKDVRIYPVEDITVEKECFFPVSAENTTSSLELNYDGNNHSISNVAVNYSGNAGIFGTLNGGSVSNLLVRDSDIISSSSSASSSNAGGLIGHMTGTAVEKCAANGTVSSSGTAGGLIGTATSGTVTACYSAGHTDGTYASYYTGGTVTYGTDGKPTNGIYNINAGDTGTAGGLIGDAGSTTIESSYSTCSAKGNIAGGLVGNAAGTIKNSYATGLVSGTTEGAFAGSFSGAATDCHYYEIINERKNDKEAFIYLVPVQGKETIEGIAALDASAQTYNDFSFPNKTGYSWQPAVPNDAALKAYYIVDGDSVYNLRTVAQLGATVSDDDLVATHYGDWPAPEILIINES